MFAFVLCKVLRGLFKPFPFMEMKLSSAIRAPRARVITQDRWVPETEET